MLVDFFLHLKSFKLPVSTREFLTLLEALEAHVVSLSIDDYRAQLAALGDVLAAHDGPIVLAGDLNTWTAARKDAVGDVARRLGLSEVTFVDDRRALFFGRQLDHIFVRGLRVLASTAIAVTSSDHNPVAVTLQVTDR